MANSKITDLVNKAAPIGADIIPIVDSVASDNKKVLLSNLPLSSAAVTALAAKQSKGAKTIFVLDNGEFASGQAAIDAAVAGDVLVFGQKAGGWGDISVPAGKTISIVGLQSENGVLVKFGSLDFSPTSGINIITNELYIDNCYFTKGTGTVVTFGGTAPARLRMKNCYIYGGASSRLIHLTNQGTYGGVNSSAYIDNTICNAANAIYPTIETSTQYVRFWFSECTSGLVNLKINAGTFESKDSAFTCDKTTEIIQVAAAGAYFLCGRSLISNKTTNGSGVDVATGAAFSNHDNTFDIATGTGYCVKGTGYHLYGSVLTNNNALAAGNVKMKNTLTNVPYTMAFTSSV
jgi:hypothetical protein